MNIRFSLEMLDISIYSYTDVLAFLQAYFDQIVKKDKSLSYNRLSLQFVPNNPAYIKRIVTGVTPIESVFEELVYLMELSSKEEQYFSLMVRKDRYSKKKLYDSDLMDVLEKKMKEEQARAGEKGKKSLKEKQKKLLTSLIHWILRDTYHLKDAKFSIEFAKKALKDNLKLYLQNSEYWTLQTSKGVRKNLDEILTGILNDLILAEALVRNEDGRYELNTDIVAPAHSEKSYNLFVNESLDILKQCFNADPAHGKFEFYTFFTNSKKEAAFKKKLTDLAINCIKNKELICEPKDATKVVIFGLEFLTVAEI